MELRQLRYFCAVAEELSYARAARRLFIAQPALSIQVRQLEQELGVQLLLRTTRRVELTHAGSNFYTEAREILTRAEVAGKHAQDAAQGLIGDLRVAMLSNIATLDLGNRVRAFQGRFPGVKVTLLEASTHRQIKLILDGEIDVGLLRFSRQVERGKAVLADREDAVRVNIGMERFAIGAGLSAEELASEEIARQRMIVAVPCDSPLGRKKEPLVWRDFDGQPIILTADPGERYFEPFLACCAQQDARPILSQRAYELMTRLWLVASGFGFTPTTAASREIAREGVCYRDLPDDGPEVLTFAAWRKADRAPHLLHFVEMLKNTSSADGTKRAVY